MTAETVAETSTSTYVIAPGKDLTRILSNVLPSAGKDETLPILTAVHVKVTADRIEVAATDRYTLSVDYIEHGKDDPEWPAVEFNLSGKDVASIVKLVKAGKFSLSPLTIELAEHGKFTASAWDGSIGSQVVDGQFPAYDKLFWEGDGESLGEVGVNPAQFARFAKIADGTARKAPLPLLLRFNGRKPILVTTPGYSSFRALVMPVRMS